MSWDLKSRCFPSGGRKAGGIQPSSWSCEARQDLQASICLQGGKKTTRLCSKSTYVWKSCIFPHMYELLQRARNWRVIWPYFKKVIEDQLLQLKHPFSDLTKLCNVLSSIKGDVICQSPVNRLSSFFTLTWQCFIIHSSSDSSPPASLFIFHITATSSQSLTGQFV